MTMDSVRKKPVGGIVAVTVSPLGGAALPDMLLADGKSSYTEEISTENGLLRVHHTLSIVVPRETVRQFLPYAGTLAVEGGSARVTTAAGESLTVGWTESLGWEHPLRLTAVVIGSGARPADGNLATIRLECDDTTALLQEE